MQASGLAHFMTVNGGHLCARPQVVVTSKNWPQREEFLKQVKLKLEASPPQMAFYPGSAKNHKAHVDALLKETGKSLGSMKVDKPLSDKELPVIFATGLDSSRPLTIFKQEVFGVISGETALDAPNAAEFLKSAVKFVNTKCWGSLDCTIIIDPKTLKENAKELEEATDDLEFGSIGVNVCGAVLVPFPGGWGSYPKHTVQDIQSGIGRVGGFCALNGLLKTVCTAPWSYLGQTVSPCCLAERDLHRKVWYRSVNFILYDTWATLGKTAVALVSGL
eukprot:Platyproteum_vivax@DN5825_c0_g1_i1.p1